MLHEVLQDSLGALNDVDISPVHPRVLGFEGSGKQVISSAPHSFPTRTLSLKRMPLLNVLAQHEVKILLDDGGAIEGNMVIAALDAVKLIRENSDGIISRVRD